MIYGNAVGGIGLERTYILVDEKGKEVAGVMVENEAVFDATANDIRIGKTAATAEGVTTGEKEIPLYQTREGVQYIPAGSELVIKGLKNYEYTKLQALVCVYASSMSGSVATEKVAINDKVYAAESTEVLAEVTTDPENKSINLGIKNEGTSPVVIRYFTYKEEL